MRWQIRLAVDLDSAASGPRTSARVASMSRSDSPRTQPEITSDSNALVRATPEQPRAERLVGAAQLGTLQLDRAHRRLDTRRWLPAVAASCRAVHVAALVAGPAEERVDLGLEGGLHHQPHAQPGNVLQDRREVTTGAEQLIDLGAQPVGG